MFDNKEIDSEQALASLTDFPEDNADQALTYALECMVSANELSAALEQAQDARSLTAVQIAAESAIIRLQVPGAALEDASESTAVQKSVSEKQRTRIQKTVSYLYAAVKRIFQFFFDWTRQQSHAAREYMALSKRYVDKVGTFGAKQLYTKINDQGLVTALHIDGIAPRRPGVYFEDLVAKYKAVNSGASLPELDAMLRAAKKEDVSSFVHSAGVLHASLIEGVQQFMDAVADPKAHPAFKNEHKGKLCFATPASFGQNYITAVVSESIEDDGHFSFKSTIARDAQVVVRASSLEVLKTDDIKHICRTVLRLTELIIEHSQDETTMQRLLREASFFVTQSGGESAVPAMQNFSAVANNQYFAYLRHCVKAMQLLMRWCRLSIAQYEATQGASSAAIK